jgi:hypothetical protein
VKSEIALFREVLYSSEIAFLEEPKMQIFRGILAGIAFTTSILGCTQQRTGIAAVADAMGATNLNSIEYSGSGELWGFGQAYIPGERWPRFIQRSYNVATLIAYLPKEGLLYYGDGYNPPPGDNPIDPEERQ